MEKIKPFYVLDVPVYPYTMDGAVNFLNSQVKKANLCRYRQRGDYYDVPEGRRV